MTSVGTFEAKTHLTRLLERVARGERIVITNRGKPVAMLVPPEADAKRDSAQVGREAAHWVYVMLVLGAYVAVGLAVMVGALPTLALLTLFSLPLMAWILRDAERGAEGHLRAIAMIDLMTARLHSAFGVLLLVGLVAGSAVR